MSGHDLPLPQPFSRRAAAAAYNARYESRIAGLTPGRACAPCGLAYPGLDRIKCAECGKRMPKAYLRPEKPPEKKS